MIESVDGRAHLPFAREVFGKGKPVYIDKPLGGNLREVLEIAVTVGQRVRKGDLILQLGVADVAAKGDAAVRRRAAVQR